MDDGRWTMDDGRWTMDDGRWTMDDGRHTAFPDRISNDKNVYTRHDTIRYDCRVYYLSIIVVIISIF